MQPKAINPRVATMGRRVAGHAMALLLLGAAMPAGAAPAPAPAAPAAKPVVEAPQTGPLTPAQIARIAIPSIVLIRTPNGQGTGFFAGADGRILTNFHVIRGAGEAVVVTADLVEHKDIEVIGIDRAHDLAVLSIGVRGQRPLVLGDSESAAVGERVVAIGNPLGFGDTISDGLLSGVRQFDDGSVLQISAPISSGSSGGPVFNERGEVIGVSTFVITKGQNLNFAVPINAAKALLAGKEAKPLSAYAEKAIVRNIPRHPILILNGCPIPELRATYEAIARAIQIGAPLYNDGNFEACYRIYAGAALEVDRTVKGCAGPKAALATGVANADKLSEWTDKAWAMRDAFDGLLALADTGRGNTPAGPRADRFTLLPAALDGCASGDLQDIAKSIGAAIDVGGPLYDAGNSEACYRIYAGAVADIGRRAPGCPAARSLLDRALKTAEAESGAPARAWVLRDAFNTVTGAIEARTKSSIVPVAR